MPYLQEIEWLATERSNMRKLLIDWGNTNSGTYNLPGIIEMQEKIKSLFINLDADIKTLPTTPYSIVDDTGNKKKQVVGDVLYMHKRPQAPRQIILCGHCDTVFDINDNFQKVKTINENVLNGPGITDMKGGLIVMYYALLALEKSAYKDNLGWRIFINADEEVGSIGSAPILEKIVKNVEFGFVYEPALDETGTLAYRRKGSGNFTLCVSGKSSHVGRAFEQGHSATVGLAQLISEIHNLNKRKNLIINVGQIHGGGPLNQVPDFALCRLNVRTQNTSDESDFLNQLDDIIQKVSKENKVTISHHGNFTRKPKIIDDKNKKLYEHVIQQANLLDIALNTKSTGGCCDGNNLSALGIPNVDTLGVCGGKIHSQDEYILLDSLIKRAALSAMLYISIANGDDQ